MKLKLSKVSITFITCFLLNSHVFANSDDKWGGYVEFFGKPGTERSLAKGDMFIPLYQNEEFLLFTNIRAVFDDQSNREGNFGFGARRLFDNWIIGGYTYFDVKESNNDNTFKQGALGFELLSNEWDFRINGYIAESDEEDADDLCVIEVDGNQIGARLGEERALPGADFEVGRKLSIFEDTRFFVGGFYFDASNYEKVSGPKARFEMRFHDLSFFKAFSKGSRLTIGAEFTDDSVRGSQTFGIIQLRIPFGSHSTSNTPKLTTLERRMVDSVVRNDDVMVSERLRDDVVPVVNPSSGQVINFVDTIDANTTNVPATVTAAGQNSLVIADGSQGVINVAGTTVNTQPGQIIIGGGQTINLQAEGKAIPFTPAGQRPTISRTGAGDLLYVNNDNNVSLNGLDLQGGRPLRIRNSTNVSVSDVTVNSTAGTRQAVFVQANSNVTFTNLNVNSAGRQGVLLNTGSSASFNNLNINSTGFEALSLNNATVQIQNGNIADSNREGIRALNGSSLVIDNLSITRTNREAIEVNNSMLTLMNSSIQDINVSTNDDGITAVNNSTLNIDNVQIDNVTSQGVLISNNVTANINRLMVSNTVHEGIFSNNSTLNLTDVMISDTGREGVELVSTTAQLTDIVIRNTGQQGMRIRGSSIVTASNVSINNTGAQGMLIQNTANVMLDGVTINGTGAQGLLTANNSSTVLNNTTILNTGSIGIHNQRNATFNANDVVINNTGSFGIYNQRVGGTNPSFTGNEIRISDTANDGVLSNGGNLTLSNSAVQNVGNGGANDDAFHLVNTTLGGVNNSIQGTINNGLACRTNAGNTGSISFSFGPIASCP